MPAEKEKESCKDFYVPENLIKFHFISLSLKSFFIQFKDFN